MRPKLIVASGMRCESMESSPAVHGGSARLAFRARLAALGDLSCAGDDGTDDDVCRLFLAARGILALA